MGGCNYGEIALDFAVSVHVLLDFCKDLVPLDQFAKDCLVSVQERCLAKGYHELAAIVIRAVTGCGQQTALVMSQVEVAIWIEYSKCPVVLFVNTATDDTKSGHSFGEVRADV